MSHDYAAAFVAATVTQDGGGALTRGVVRIVPFEGEDAYVRFAPYTEYLYDVRWLDGEVRVFFIDANGGDHEVGICQMPPAVVIGLPANTLALSMNDKTSIEE